MPRGQARSWNDDERLAVATLLLAGGSMGRIARQLGVTRNMVIGRIHRDGRLLQFVGRVVIERTARMPPIATRLPDPGAFACEGFSGARPLAELKRDDCRWPVAAAEVVGGHLFCARPAVPQRSYCAEHERRARP